MHHSCNQDVLIYRFIPHGSRKIDDCRPLYFTQYDKLKIVKQIKVICYDQETCNYKEYINKVNLDFEIPGTPYPILNSIHKGKHINGVNVDYHDYVLLLHSEMQSQDVKWFEQHGSIGVYWWCHALIARDWFRYAEVDPMLLASNAPQTDFLIYNRAWAGLREYRIKFTELIVNYNLQDHCQLTFNPIDDEKHWLEHEFVNPAFAPSRTDLDQYFIPSTVDGTASADYNNMDYVNTLMEVVLETIFDDTKWHLTEKSLRPIACGHPFILVSTPGILQYLKRYGFKTFGEYIDESYDNITDPGKRLESIVKLMQSLANLSDKEKQQLYSNLAPICEYNKHRFFSQEFFDQVVNEFQTNFDCGYSFVQQADSHKYFERDFERCYKMAHGTHNFTLLSQ